MKSSVPPITKMYTV